MPRTWFSQGLRSGSSVPLCLESLQAGLGGVGTGCKCRSRARVGICLWISWALGCAECPERSRTHTHAHAAVCLCLHVSESTEAFPGKKAEPELRQAPTQGEGSAGPPGLLGWQLGYPIL